MKISKPSFLFFFIALLGLLSFGVRLLPHFPNFTPIGAMALFIGAYGAKKYQWSLLVPLAVMFISDLFIGFYDFKLMAVVYGSFFVYSFIGMFFAKKPACRQAGNLAFAVLGSILGATFFYLSTNFAVWAFSSLYPHTLQGLVTSYTLALPFFKYTLAGDIFFAGIFFGAYELTKAYVFRLREQQKLA